MIFRGGHIERWAWCCPYLSVGHRVSRANRWWWCCESPHTEWHGGLKLDVRDRRVCRSRRGLIPNMREAIASCRHGWGFQGACEGALAAWLRLGHRPEGARRLVGAEHGDGTKIYTRRRAKIRDKMVHGKQPVQCSTRNYIHFNGYGRSMDFGA